MASWHGPFVGMKKFDGEPGFFHRLVRSSVLWYHTTHSMIVVEPVVESVNTFLHDCTQSVLT